MWNRNIFFLISLVHLSVIGSLQADDKMVAAVDDEAASSTSLVETDNRQMVMLSVGAGITIFDSLANDFIDSDVAYGINILPAFKVSQNTPFYIGIDIAVHRMSRDLTIAGIAFDVDNTFVRLMPAAFYRFGDASSVIRPYAGLSVGPALEIVSVSSDRFNESETDTNVLFGLASKIGVEFALSSGFSIAVEPKAVLYDFNNFAFEPSITGVFSF